MNSSPSFVWIKTQCGLCKHFYVCLLLELLKMKILLIVSEYKHKLSDQIGLWNWLAHLISHLPLKKKNQSNHPSSDIYCSLHEIRDISATQLLKEGNNSKIDVIVTAIWPSYIHTHRQRYKFSNRVSACKVKPVNSSQHRKLDLDQLTHDVPWSVAIYNVMSSSYNYPVSKLWQSWH